MKHLSVFLSAILIMSVLCGCGTSESGKTADGDVAATSEDSAAEETTVNEGTAVDENASEEANDPPTETVKYLRIRTIDEAVTKEGTTNGPIIREYEYDQAGRNIRVVKTDTDGYQYVESEDFYEGNVHSKELYYNRDGSVTTYVFSYASDTLDDSVSETITEIYEEDVLISTLVTELHYGTLLVDGVETKVETSRYLYNDGELSSKIDYTYDEMGRMISEVSTNGDSSPTNVTEYFYEGDRLVQANQTMTYYDNEKNPSYSPHYTYSYISFDEHGNWTEQIETENDNVGRHMYMEYTYDEHGEVIKKVNTTIWGAGNQSIETTEYERFVVPADQ